MWSSSIRKASWNWKKVAVLTLCFMLLNDNHRYRGNKGSWWNRPHAGRWTIARRVVRVFYMYIIYNFTEVQVSRVIIVLLLQNCFVWCKDHTHQAILTTEQLPDECGHCTTRNSSVAIKQWLLVKPEPLWSYIYIADAPQSIESSALRNTFYSKNEFIYIYIYIHSFTKRLTFQKYI